MKFNAEVQVEYMLDGFSDKLFQLVSEYKRVSAPTEVSQRAKLVEEMYHLTESYVRAKVVGFIPITYAKGCTEQIYIHYFESLEESMSDTKEQVISHFLKTINSMIDAEIARIAKKELEHREEPRALKLEEVLEDVKTLDIQMSKEDAQDLLDKLLSHLPDFCAYDISLYYVQKLSIPEIAKRTNVGVDRVNKKLDFGRQHIKNQLRIKQSNGEINTFGLSLQKFFDWLVEFEATNDVLDCIKKQLKLCNAKNIDYTKVKQRYKNLLLGSYEEDPDMTKAFSNRLRSKKKEATLSEHTGLVQDAKEENIAGTRIENVAKEEDITKASEAISGFEIADKTKITDQKVAALDIANHSQIVIRGISESENGAWKEDSAKDEPVSGDCGDIVTSDAIQENVSDENTSDVSAAHERVSAAVSNLDATDEVLDAESMAKGRSTDENHDGNDFVHTPDNEDGSEGESTYISTGEDGGEDNSTQISTQEDGGEDNSAQISTDEVRDEDDFADGDLPGANEDANEMEQDSPANDKSIIILLLTLIGAVGAAILYFLAHFLM